MSIMRNKVFTPLIESFELIETDSSMSIIVLILHLSPTDGGFVRT